ncbi:Ti-type conjugative transfer relaxase [Azospirillum sp. B510]|uniref:MobA/MobL family protein n=1 Tax=Azospirillum sp. (strain B510) TaxID=137722 RepID=UPI0001C4C387|nr:MobA/MobL family protein [Azospirillum sp. B510]BAI72026.1 Ti-type conjugative transfer relaxase [Azospirillum sp. B510]
MTSLPSGEAHFHFGAKVGQRSAGRSSVAAAAYRAGQRLHDERLGQTFDYSRKRHITDAFILVPADAPAWASDRGALWGAVERAEKRRDASLWREIEVSLPRDLPPEAYRPLLEQALAPYVAAGLAADVCVHCPPAADGGPQPHAHVMITTRALGQDGFAARKSDDLIAILDGAKGAPRGEALKVERQRWADEINRHLRAVASDRRVDARSYAERGLDRQAEPKMGERAAQRHRRQRERHARDPTAPPPRPSARQRHVGAIRALRKTENALLELETEMVKADKKDSSAAKQEIKVNLLRERLGPDLDYENYRGGVYMVDTKNPNLTRVQFRDDSWAEIDHQSERIKTWGAANGTAADFALDAAAALDWQDDVVSRLPTSARTRGPGRRLNAEEASDRADWWREQGYTDVTTSGGRVLIGIGPSRLVDSGDRCELHGPVTEDAIRAMVANAKDHYGTPPRARTWGSDEFRALYWLEAQRQGVEVVDYEPPEHVRRQWEEECQRTARTEAAVGTVADRAALARQLRAYAAGDTETPPSPEVGLAVAALTPDQRARLARSEPYELIPQLAGLQMTGQDLAAGVAPAGQPGPAVRPAAPASRPEAEELPEWVQELQAQGAVIVPAARP